MKRNIIGVMAALLLLAGCNSAPKDELEKRVDEIVSKMTLDEKIGQMTQLEVSYFARQDPSGEVVIDEAKMKEAIETYKVGSFLNNPSGVALTRDNWVPLIDKIQKMSMDVMGIPCIYGLDQNHGCTYILGSTLFPQNINMGATFNTDLTRQEGEITAYESRSASVAWIFNPTVDLARDARWPRHWENFGEDAYVNAINGTTEALAYQSGALAGVDAPGSAMAGACMKHYMGYGVPASGKDRTPSHIPVAEMREKHFAPYKMALENGAMSIMVNSGNNDGVPFHANHELLTVWAKDELEWDGVIVTDWADINNLYTRDFVAKDKKDAIRQAINAGIDMSMDPYSTDFCVLLKELVEEGAVAISRIDDAARRIVRMKLRLGLFENPSSRLEDYPKFGCDEFAAVSRQAATESIVLLKNGKKNDNGNAHGNWNRSINDANATPVLPIEKGKKIAVVGPNANSMRCLLGGWTITWQGNMSDFFLQDKNTILEAMQNEFGADNVLYAEGVRYNQQQWDQDFTNDAMLAEALAAARKADIVVCCVGENSYCETPGNINDLNLSENQLNLVREVAKAGKPVVMVLSEGRPRLVNDIEPLCDAVIDVMLPGTYGGEALAALLSGRENFSGRLPFTYPRYSAALITYDYKPCEQRAKMEGSYDYTADVFVQWPFSYGLSYTTFEYKNLRVEKSADNVFTTTVDITNTGNQAGKEAVILFTSDLIATSTPDVRRVRRFDKVDLQPGETKSVTFTLPADELSYVNQFGEWVLEPGTFRFQVGNLATDVEL